MVRTTDVREEMSTTFFRDLGNVACNIVSVNVVDLLDVFQAFISSEKQHMFVSW